MAATVNVFAILASAVVVLGGLIAVTRALWRVAQDIRDNKRATVANTAALGELSIKMDGRISLLESRVATLEIHHP